MRQEASDEMFVKWSKGRSDRSWDTQFVAKLTKDYQLKHGLDVGGGIGTFAKAICELNNGVEFIDVVDPSIQAHANFVNHQRTSLIKGTMNNIHNPKYYEFITINLVCHHIISSTSKDTLDAQIKFLRDASSLLKDDGLLFVEENIYESLLFKDLCGRLIYELTSLRMIAKATRKLGANTAGEGVCFHSDDVWRAIFNDAGFKVAQTFDNINWGSKMPIWQKIPLLCKGRYQRIYVLQKDIRK